MTLLQRLQTFCWHCGWFSNEWFGIRGFIARKGMCFYCRMDRLDEKYGPSQLVEDNRQLSKNKQYKSVYRPSRWVTRNSREEK